MIRCIAIDDESLALRLLEDNISKVPFLKLVAAFQDPFRAMEMMRSESVDLVFIDIQMPGLTGLQLIETLTFKPMVILITAYKQYALEGYDLNVVDYLLKPVAMERFLKACNKARELYLLKNPVTGQAAAGEYIFVNAGYSLVKVIFTDILYVEGLKDYIKIYLKSASSPLVVRSGLRAFLEQLPTGEFLQVHKSFILSVSGITSIRKNSVFIGKQEFFIGDTFKDEVHKRIH
jgi:two-component system LytT family response regulator